MYAHVLHVSLFGEMRELCFVDCAFKFTLARFLQFTNEVEGEPKSRTLKP